MYIGDLFLNKMKTAKKKIITGNQLAYYIRNYANPTVVYLGHGIFFSKKKYVVRTTYYLVRTTYYLVRTT